MEKKYAILFEKFSVSTQASEPFGEESIIQFCKLRSGWYWAVGTVHAKL